MERKWNNSGSSEESKSARAESEGTWWKGLGRGSLWKAWGGFCSLKMVEKLSVVKRMTTYLLVYNHVSLSAKAQTQS